MGKKSPNWYLFWENIVRVAFLQAVARLGSAFFAPYLVYMLSVKDLWIWGSAPLLWLYRHHESSRLSRTQENIKGISSRDFLSSLPMDDLNVQSVLLCENWTNQSNDFLLKSSPRFCSNEYHNFDEEVQIVLVFAFKTSLM